MHMSTHAELRQKYNKIADQRQKADAAWETVHRTAPSSSQDPALKLFIESFTTLIQSMIKGHQEKNDITYEYEEFMGGIYVDPSYDASVKRGQKHNIRKAFANIPPQTQNKFFEVLHSINELTSTVENSLNGTFVLPASVHKSMQEYLENQDLEKSGSIQFSSRTNAVQPKDDELEASRQEYIELKIWMMSSLDNAIKSANLINNEEFIKNKIHKFHALPLSILLLHFTTDAEIDQDNTNLMADAELLAQHLIAKHDREDFATSANQDIWNSLNNDSHWKIFKYLHILGKLEVIADKSKILPPDVLKGMRSYLKKYPDPALIPGVRMLDHDGDAELAKLKKAIDDNPDTFKLLAVEFLASQPVSLEKQEEITNRSIELFEWPMQLFMKANKADHPITEEAIENIVFQLTASYESEAEEMLRRAAQKSVLERFFKKEKENLLNALHQYGHLERLKEFSETPKSLLPDSFVKELFKFVPPADPLPIPAEEKSEMPEERLQRLLAEFAEAEQTFGKEGIAKWAKRPGINVEKSKSFRDSEKRLEDFYWLPFEILILAYESNKPEIEEYSDKLIQYLNYNYSNSSLVRKSAKIAVNKAFSRLKRDNKLDQFYEILQKFNKLEDLLPSKNLTDRLETILPNSVLRDIKRILNERQNAAISDSIAENTDQSIERESPVTAEILQESIGLTTKLYLLVSMELYRKGYNPDDFRIEGIAETKELFLTDEDMKPYLHPVTGEKIVIIPNDTGIDPIDIPDQRGSFIYRAPKIWNETYAMDIPLLTPDFMGPAKNNGHELVGAMNFNSIYLPPIVPDQLTVIEVENLLPDGEMDKQESGGKRRIFGEASAPRNEERYHWVLEALRTDGLRYRDLIVYRDKMLSGVDLRHHPYVIIEAKNEDHHFQIAVCQTVGHATFIIRNPVDLSGDIRVTRSDLKKRTDVYQISCHNREQYLTNIRHYAYSNALDEQIKTRTYWARKIEPFLQAFFDHYQKIGSIPPTYDQSIVDMSNGERTTFRRMYQALYNGSVRGLENIDSKELLELELQTNPNLDILLEKHQPAFEPEPEDIEEIPVKIIDLKEAFTDAVLYMLIKEKFPENDDLTDALIHGHVTGAEEMGISSDVKLDKDFYVACGLGTKISNDNYQPAPKTTIRQFARLLG